MDTKQVPVTFRATPEEREELRRILLRGGLGLQDLGHALIQRIVHGDHRFDPQGALGMLRTQTARGELRRAARTSMLGEPDADTAV